MEKIFILVGLILIFIFFATAWYSVACIKKIQQEHVENIKKLSCEIEIPKKLISEYLNDQQELVNVLSKKINGHLNSHQSWIEYSFRKPYNYQTVSLLLENDDVIEECTFNPSTKTFIGGGLHISPLKVKQWKKIFS